MSKKQKTIKKDFSISGKGLHTGLTSNVTLHPAKANHGIVFRRIDLDEPVLIEADIDNVVDVSRSTTLGKDNVRISTVEHLLAAISGLEIDNVLIDIDNEEVPILDGSSQPFIDKLQDAGIEELDESKSYIVIREPITVRDEERNIELTISPAPKYSATVMIDYGSKVLGTQHARINKIEEFSSELANSRTFVFFHELEALHNAGLVKGGDVDNAIVIVENEVEQAQLDRLSKLFSKEKIEVKKGYLSNVELRNANEPARHKLLDVIGDLTLVGKSIKGNVTAIRPGHRMNVELAKAIKSAAMKQNRKQAPEYNPTEEPILDAVEIYKRLPHGAPFQLVDKIVHLDSESVVGVKNITINEPHFTGHFPGNPVFPGVLQLEALAQVGAIYVLNTVDDPENYYTYFMGINNCKFRRMVKPGDTLVIKCEPMRPISRGIAQMKGRAFVGEICVCECEVLASIVRKDA